MFVDAGGTFSLEGLGSLIGLDSYGLSVLKIIGANIVLSGDNAIVIALACRTLPRRQRTRGIILGGGAAILLRIIFTLAVGSLLDIPYVAIGGGLLLFWIAVKLLIADEPNPDSVQSGNTLWEAIKTIAVADVVMSLDNVLAIAGAAKGDHMLIILGLALSIPLIVGGSTLLSELLARFPVLVWAGGGLLGWIAGELIAQEKVLRPSVESAAAALHLTPHAFELTCAALGAIAVLGIGRMIVSARAADAA